MNSSDVDVGLNSVEDIKLATVRESWIIASEEINEICNRFRNLLNNGQVSGYKSIFARLYFEIGCVSYKYYNKDSGKNDICSVISYMKKSLDQFDHKQKLMDRINIIKEIKYFLDSTCDLYVKSNFSEDMLPCIPGNAVVFVPVTGSRSIYWCYFVEDGEWIPDLTSNLKFKLKKRVNLDNISINNRSGLACKSETNAEKVESITRQAQIDRRRMSIKMKYYALKREEKKLEKDLKYIISTSQNFTDAVSTDSPTTVLSVLKDTAAALKSKVLSILNYPHIDRNNLPKVTFEVLRKLIECNLEIGWTDRVEYYIKILEQINFSELSSEISEYRLRNELIIKLRNVIEMETDLLIQHEDDVQSIRVAKAKNSTEYDKEFERWKKNQCVQNNRSILFIFNPNEEKENHWECFFWIHDKARKVIYLEISDKTILSTFLNHVYYSKTMHLFVGELLDMLDDMFNDRDVLINRDVKASLFNNNEFILKSKKAKVIHLCYSLSQAYEFIGHYLLKEHYGQVVRYLIKQRKKFLTGFSSSYNLNFPSMKSSKMQSSLDLFPNTYSVVKSVNDQVNEKEFFLDILPFLDYISDLIRAFNIIHTIDWKYCQSEDKKEIILQEWLKEYDKIKQSNIFIRKFLLLLIECDFYLLVDFNEKNPPKIMGNAIIFTKLDNHADFECYFVKDSFWIRDKTNHNRLKSISIDINNLENVSRNKKTGLIDKTKFYDSDSRVRIEKIAKDMHLNRWYFYGELAHKRISEGFIDQKQELHDLQLYLNDIARKELIEQEVQNREIQILDCLSKLFNESLLFSEDHFIEYMSNSSQTNIRIYDLRKNENCKHLKQQIYTNCNQYYACIIRLLNRSYLSVLVDRVQSDINSICSRVIYIMNSTLNEINLKELIWLTGVHDSCFYKLNFIACPKQKLLCDDSLLHAYFNASACKWACNRGHWEFLKKYFARQYFSTKENIEKIKYWLIGRDIKISRVSDVQNQVSENRNTDFIGKFQNYFSKFIYTYYSLLDSETIQNSLEDLIQNLSTIKDFNDVRKYIKSINEPEDIDCHLSECIDGIERKQDSIGVDVLVDIMRTKLKEYSLCLNISKESILESLLYFEDRLHDALLLTITQERSIPFGVNEHYASSIKSILDLGFSGGSQTDIYKKLDNYFLIQPNFCNVEEILLICKNIQENLKEDGLKLSKSVKESLMRIHSFVTRLETIEIFLGDFHAKFQTLLYYCYESLGTEEINSSLKDDIYNRILRQQQNFDGIKSCINQLFGKAKEDISLKKDFNLGKEKKSFKEFFEKIDGFVKVQDEQSIYFVSSFLRKTILNSIDTYMKSLTKFRYCSLVAMKNFEREFHRLLLSVVQDSIQKNIESQSLLKQAKTDVGSIKLEKLNYDEKIQIYTDLISKISKSRCDFISPRTISSVTQQLENLSHSHQIYLEIKLGNIIKIVNKFDNVAKNLSEFNLIFRQCLISRYDHLSEEEVFSDRGRIKREILDCLQPNKTFSDIEKSIEIFKNDQLNESIRRCEKSFDDKSSAEISRCLRKCILDTIQDFTISLLTYRQRALKAFCEFEKHLYQYLSSYEAIQDQSLKLSIKKKLDELENNSDANYDNYFLTYNGIVNSFDEPWSQEVKEIFKKKEFSLKPCFTERIINLKNILHRFVNWYEIEKYDKYEYSIIKMKTSSATLSDVMKVIKNKYSDCLCPNNEIRIITSDKLYIDEDLEYSGLNIVIVSSSIELVKDKSKFIINTNGIDAIDCWRDNAAANGFGTEENGVGKKGVDGCDGKHGKSAGNIYVVANKLPIIEASACGGKGGQGQCGGNGAWGRDGLDGKDVDTELLKKDLEPWYVLFGQAWSYRLRRLGTDGKPGCWGGEGGSGGFRGDGGYPGLVKLLNLNDDSQLSSYKCVAGEQGNCDGNAGHPGEAGKHGRDGRDCVAISNYAPIIKALFQSRKVDNVKCGRLSESFRFKTDERKFHDTYEMLPMEYDEDNYRFQSKYADISLRRENITIPNKHKDREVLQRIHSINYQHVFEETSQHFDQYCNPLKSGTYQHWLAPKLSEFLRNMALFHDTPLYNLHTEPDIKHDGRQILVLKEKFSQMIHIVNERLRNEKLDTDEMDTGVITLGHEILNQQNEFLSQYQLIYQQLQQELQEIDTNELTTGLESRNAEMAKIKSRINRLINEQNFQERLAITQTRTEMLIDMPKESLSKEISQRQNIKLIKDSFNESSWKEFPLGNYIFNDDLLTKFNNEPNEITLLKIGYHFLLQLFERLHQPQDERIHLNKISQFIYIYLYNLQQSNYAFSGIKCLQQQNQILNDIFLRYEPLHRHTSVLDLLIEFSRGLHREYVRQYWLLWTTKTLELQQECTDEDIRNNRDDISNIIQHLRNANDSEIEQFNSMLEDCQIIKEFPDFNFDSKLYGNNVANLKESIENFNQTTNEFNLMKIFRHFSDSQFFQTEELTNSFQKLLTNHEQLSIIGQLLYIFHHNLVLTNIGKESRCQLIQYIKKIQPILHKNPRSYLHDIIYHLCNQINLKEISTKDHSSSDKLTVEQYIDAFNTLYDPNLIESIFEKLSTSKNIDNLLKNKKILEFIKWTTNNLILIQDEVKEKMLSRLETSSNKLKNDSIKFLRVILDYKQLKFSVEKQYKSIESTKADDNKKIEEFISILTRCNILYNVLAKEKNLFDLFDLKSNLDQIINFEQPKEFRGISTQKLSELETLCQNLLKNLLTDSFMKQINSFLKDSRTTITSELEDDEKLRFEEFVNTFQSRTIRSIHTFLEKQISSITDQQKCILKFNNTKYFIQRFDQSFDNLENVDDDTRLYIANEFYKIYDVSNETFRNNTRSHEDLMKSLNFCALINFIKQNIVERVQTHLRNSITFKENFEIILRNALKTYENNEADLCQFTLSFVEILNLSQFNPDDKVEDFLNRIREKLSPFQNIEKTNILKDIIESYTTYENELDFFKKCCSECTLLYEDYLCILSFLYQESSKKSEFVGEVYRSFYDYCRNIFSLKLAGKIKCQNIISLMKLINRAHHDSLHTDEIDIDYAQFQVIILHIILKKENGFIDIDDQLIVFLDWLFRILSEYAFIENIEDIDIGKDQINFMNKLSSSIDKYVQDNPQTNVIEYKYLRESIPIVSKNIRLIFVQKSIKILFEENPHAKWLEVILYFSESFEEDLDTIANLLLNNEKSTEVFEKIIFNRISLVQKTKLDYFYSLVLKQENNDNHDLKSNLEIRFKEINGCITNDCPSYEKIHPYFVINFNILIDTLNRRLETDNGLSIDFKVFFKIQDILSCFEDIRIPKEHLSSLSQNAWLKVLLAEHIIEKYIFIFSPKDDIEKIRQLLMRTDEKILFLFNNMFMSQYLDQIYQSIYKSQNPIPSYRKIAKEKFDMIVQLMGEVTVSQSLLDQLSDGLLSVWDIILHEIQFSQIFNREMTKIGVNLNENNLENQLFFLNRIRIQSGIPNKDRFLKFFQTISEKMVQAKTNDIKELSDLLKSIYYQEISFEEALNIVTKFNYTVWSQKKKCIRDRKREKLDRSAKEIIDQMKTIANVSLRKSLEQIADDAIKYREEAKSKCQVLTGNEKSEINRQIQGIYNHPAYQEKPEEYVLSHLNEIIPLLLGAWSIANKPQFPKDSQIVAFLIFVHSLDKGILEQIRTGEGKTLIVGLTAAYLALCGHVVDIVSSNRDLAIEGEKKCRSFFQLLKIESGHICHGDDEVNHESYKIDSKTQQGNIVYGEIGAFQRDILEHEFNGKNIFGERYKSRTKCLIADEVDSMCLDKARHVLYLSHEIQCLKWLETLFITIWTAVLRVEINDSNDISENIEDISQFIEEHVRKKNIFVPKYMIDFVTCKLHRWIDSAFQARIMREDDHFVLDIPKIDKSNSKNQKTIIVLDKDTGIEQYSTRWSNGLAQFLELKYRRKLSVESLKAVFISNKSFFQRYKNRLYGLTGTLGSDNSQSFLFDLYRVQFVEIPTSREKSYFQFPSKIALDDNMWLDLIATETIEQVKTRPVLIICDNVETTENVWNELIRHNVSVHTIQKYRRDGDNIEERFQKEPAKAGDIIIATNKGGRGTDIHVNQEINQKSGMHVILTYLPDNVRIEEQAFGRTGRNGAPGSGQFILLIDKSVYEELDELSDCSVAQKNKKLEQLADIIIEKEKIKRDNEEAARLSQLKQKDILHLETEEELFERFILFKNKMCEEKFKPLFHEKSQQKFVQAFENILKDRWAFWLDFTKIKIDKIENLKNKNDLLNEFDLSFVKNLENKLSAIDSFDNLVKALIEKPEEAIHIGKVCLQEKRYEDAKTCFRVGIDKEDPSGFSNIGYAYSIITLNNEEDIKKKSRRELKKALHCLEFMKRNLLANLKIAESLPQWATEDITRKVSKKDNLYQEQVTGKLEVVALHLHYLKKVIGDTVEPFDFIFYQKEGEKYTEEDYRRAEKIYELLVEKELIQGDTLRRTFHDKLERENMENMIRENIDPSIAGSLIDLLKKKTKYTNEDFEKIVCHNEELWEALELKEVEKVFILDKTRLEKELPQQYEVIWNKIKAAVVPNQVDMTIFEKNEEAKAFRNYLHDEKLIVETKRVEINKLDVDSLKFDGIYTKYSDIKFIDHGHEIGGLKEFLRKLKENIKTQESAYLYQYQLPFGKKQEEGNKIRIFLKEKNIIKSGGLASNKYKYGNKAKEIENSINKILDSTEFINDKQLIQSKIFTLQGDIRSYENELKANLKDFLELPELEKVPSELKFFQGIGLDKFLVIEEEKSWWDWNAFAVAMIGVAQVILGAALLCIGAVNLGAALISEGVSDMIYATIAGISGTFSWRDWAIQKSITFTLSLMTAGIGKLASLGSTAAKLGSVCTLTLCAKIAVRTTVEYGLGALANTLTEKIIKQIQDGVIKRVIEGIKDTCLAGIYNSLKNKIEYLYNINKNDIQKFETAFSSMLEDVKKALEHTTLLPQVFERLRMQIVSALRNSYQTVVSGLKRSSSKYAKALSNTIQILIVIDNIWNLVERVIDIKNLILTLKHFIEGATKENSQNLATEENDALLNERIEQMNSVIDQYLSNTLMKILDQSIRKVINKALNEVQKAMISSTEAMIDSMFKGKNPVETLKESNINDNEDSTSGYIVDESSAQQKSKRERNDQAKREDLQNNVKNPKKLRETYTSEINNNNRPLGYADLKILANLECVSIEAQHLNTGEKIIIKPEGMRRFLAFFKQSAKVNFQENENDPIGHYTSGRGNTKYVEVIGRNDCMLVAFYESLGHAVDDDFIRRKRQNLDKCINNNMDMFKQYRQHADFNGLHSMIGGRIDPKLSRNKKEIPQAQKETFQEIINPKVEVVDPQKGKDAFLDTTEKEKREIKGYQKGKVNVPGLISETLKKITASSPSTPNKKVYMVSYGSSEGTTLIETENFRWDIQRSSAGIVNFQIQKNQQRQSGSSTSVTTVILKQPPKGSNIRYLYSEDDIKTATEMSLNQRKIVRLSPRSTEKTEDRSGKQNR